MEALSWGGIVKGASAMGIGAVLAVILVNANISQNAAKDKFLQEELPGIIKAQTKASTELTAAFRSLLAAVNELKSSLGKLEDDVEQLADDQEKLQNRLDRVLSRVWQDYRDNLTTPAG